MALHSPANEPILPRMRPWGALQSALLMLLCLSLCPTHTRAQSASGRGSDCPPMVSCDDFKEMTGRKVFPKIIIDNVIFEGPVHLPAAALEELVASIKQHPLDGDPNWLDEIEEVVLRGTWQDNGYF